MRVAVVGSRTRRDRETVDALVADMAPDTVVVSGGCAGPDMFAEDAARARGLTVDIYLADLAGVKSQWQAARAFHARNQRVVDNCDQVIALVGDVVRQTGGTWDTIKRAQKAGKRITVLYPPQATP